MSHHPSFLAAVERARPSVAEVELDTVRRWQLEERPFVLVDVREDDEWRLDRIVGAVHIGRGVMERDIAGLYPDVDTELVLYCGGGFRSVLAAKSLMEMGYRRVSSMKEGIRGWRTRALPLVAGA